jgi:putative transposase
MRRAAVGEARAAGLSERRACRLVGQPRATERYRSVRDPLEDLRDRLKVLALEWHRRGYRYFTIVLVREGWTVNHKRVYRINREERLNVGRSRRRRKRVSEARCPMPAPSRVNECWGMDFVSDALINGRRIRILNIVDGLSREDLDGPIDTSLPAVRVVEALDRIALERGAYPERLIVDNGPEFRSRQLDAWAYQNGVALHFIDPGKPIQNALTESYNGRMRDECLNMNWWPTLGSAQAGIRKWRQRYNTERPHGSLGYKTPEEFAAHHRALSSQAVPT